MIDPIPDRPGIYWILNTVTRKHYVGSAKSLHVRWIGHRADLRANRHHCPPLQHSWNKHGEAAFMFEVLVECSEEELIPLEQAYIDDLDATNKEVGYNVCKVAGSCAGREVTEETREKISKALKGIPLSEERLTHRTEVQGPGLVARNRSVENRIKIGATRMGHEVSQETREKIRNALTGIPLSESTKAKISETLNRPQARERASRITKAKWEAMSAEEQARKVTPMQGKAPKGDDHYLCLLNARIVRSARRLKANNPHLSYQEIGELYCVKTIAIWKAITGETWRHA